MPRPHVSAYGFSESLTVVSGAAQEMINKRRKQSKRQRRKDE